MVVGCLVDLVANCEFRHRKPLLESSRGIIPLNWLTLLKHRSRRFARDWQFRAPLPQNLVLPPSATIKLGFRSIKFFFIRGVARGRVCAGARKGSPSHYTRGLRSLGFWSN